MQASPTPTIQTRFKALRQWFAGKLIRIGILWPPGNAETAQSEEQQEARRKMFPFLFRRPGGGGHI